MTVKVCPECDAEYVPSVATCAECGAELVSSDPDEMESAIAEEAAEADDRDAADLDGDEVSDEPGGDQIAYEFDEWDNASRVLLDQLLTGQGILHVWEATSLVVRADDEEAVDILVEQVETSTLPTLDPDKDQVAYELDDWPDEKRTALADSLTEAGVAFGFDEDDDLVVHAEDEERAESVLDQVDFNFSLDAGEVAAAGDDDDVEGADGDGDPEDGLVAQEVMSELFIAADRLMHAADDHDAVLSLADAAGRVKDLGVPYGFAPGVWDQIVTQSGSLHDQLEGTDSDDDEVKAAAGELRALLRQYV